MKMEKENYVALLRKRYETHVKSYLTNVREDSERGFNYLELARWEMENFMALINFREDDFKDNVRGIKILVSSNGVLEDLREGMHPGTNKLKKLEDSLTERVDGFNGFHQDPYLFRKRA